MKIMHLYTYIFFLIAVLMASCSVQKKMKETSQSAGSSVTNQRADNIYSAGAKMFMHDYRQSMESNKNMPDSVLIEKYPLEKIKDTYYVGVLARVNEQFNPDDLVPLDAITGSNARGVLSLKIPAGNLENLSSIPGIEYIDVSRKIKLKNNR